MHLMARMKPSRMGCEAAASGALCSAADRALRIASPPTCVEETVSAIYLMLQDEQQLANVAKSLSHQYETHSRIAPWEEFGCCRTIHNMIL